MSSGSDKRSIHSEINVTPLIDVMLVLLVIFIVVLPIMTKVETLEVPRTVEDGIEVADQTSLIIKVKNDLSIAFNDGRSEHDTPISAADIPRTLRPELQALSVTTAKVVFVDFEDGVPWSEVIGTMDTIRGLASDANHDEINVALRVKRDEPTQ